jgi:Asp-tRNA(Asn)/Glu-tRNA(Gln) amidotransferase A subunit family amidase
MDPTFLPAWRLAELVRGGAIGCTELLDHFIARVERLDDRTNAVVVRDFDRARDQARSLDQQRRDGRTMPLLGVPMTVKESFGVAGLGSTWVCHDHALCKWLGLRHWAPPPIEAIPTCGEL